MADREQAPSGLRRAPSNESRSERTSEGTTGAPAPADPSAAAVAEPTFEATLERLEAIVGRLEEGDLALEDALAGFEEGVRLSRRLADRLADAERRIERLTRDGGGLGTRPLDGGEGG